MDWRRYGLEQRGGKGIPYGPAIILVHIASTKVPFTSEGKEAVADFEEISNEINLALRLCARNLKSHLNKDEKRKKTRAKFEIVQEILPLIAQKSAEYLGKPVPDLDRSKSKIMNVVWVEPTVQKEKGKTRRTITYTVYNYTKQERSLRLHAQLPKESVNIIDMAQDPHFLEISDDGKATWEVDGLQPSKSTNVTFTLAGEMAETFSPDDIYISGINPVIVMGADALPGDWGIKGMDIVEYDSDLEEDDDDTAEEAENLDDE